MPKQLQPIEPDPNGGPILEILIGFSKAPADWLVKNKAIVTPPIKVRALIDSGASNTCVDAGIIGQLGYVKSDIRDWMQMSHAGSAKPTAMPRYEIGVTVPHKDGNLTVPTLMITQISLENLLIPQAQRIYALIGRDTLQQTTFTHDEILVLFMIVPFIAFHSSHVNGTASGMTTRRPKGNENLIGHKLTPLISSLPPSSSS